MPDKRKNSQHLETKLIHSGEPAPRIAGAVSIPIFQSATFEYGNEADYHSLKYIRLNNTPNHAALHEKLAALENAETALVTASGMAAISTALLTVLSAGDHLLIQDSLYGGTHDFITKDIGAFGIAYDFIDADGPDSHPRHARASELFDGFSGMISFELKGGVSEAQRFMSGVKLPISAPSLGGVETLITRPSTTSHSGMSPAASRDIGPSHPVVRWNRSQRGLDSGFQ